MKPLFSKTTVHYWLTFTLGAIIISTGLFSLHIESTAINHWEEVDVNEIINKRATLKQEQSLSLTDFHLTHQHGRNENFERTGVATVQSERIIRTSVYDILHIVVLSRKLAWYTQTAYWSALPSPWHPSILIAQGKLTI